MTIPQHSEPKVYYGWMIVLAGFLVMLCQGETMFTFGVFLKWFERDFGWSRALTSTAYSSFLLGYAFSCIVAGRLSDRFGPRPVMLFSALFGATGMSLCYFTQDINQLRAFMFICGIGTGGTWSVPTSIVQQWFKGRPRAGLALSIVSCGAGVGMLYPPLVNWLIESFTWRNTYLVMGFLFLLTTGAGGLLCRKAPWSEAGSRGLERGHSDFSVRQVLRQPAFFGVTFGVIMGVSIFQAVSSHLVAFATDVRISAAEASFALSLTGALSIPGRLLSGILADRFGWRRMFAISILTMALSIFTLLTTRGQFMLYTFAVLFGVGQGWRSTAQSGVIAELFGLSGLGLMIGITMAAGQVFGLSVPYIAGYVFDTTGSYTIAFTGLVVLAVASALGVLGIRKTPVTVSEVKKRL